MKKLSGFPPLLCDFNACGWSGRPDDNGYYVLDKTRVKEFKAGDRVFLYDNDGIDGVSEIIGIEGELLEDNGTLIARPFAQDFHRGLRFW